MQNGTNRKKLVGAVLSALVMGGLLLVITVCMLADYFGSVGNKAETVVILLCAVAGFATVVGIVLALIQRWKELQKGEEDEARKY